MAVNGVSLKEMTHKEAVDLICNQPSRVELELVETMGNIPYDLVDTVSNQSLGR